MPKEVVGLYIDKSNCISSIPELNKNVQSGTALLYWLGNSFTETLNILWDLDMSVANILARCNLSIESLQRLLDTTKLQIGQVEITYIIGKWFSAKAGLAYESPYSGFSDASQYFIAYPENNISKDDAFKRACQARDVGKEVVEGLKLMGITEPTSLVSPINQFQRRWGKHFAFPTISDLDAVDENIGQYFFESLSGGWFECFQRGHFQSVYDYDIKSAYSSLLCTLPDFRLGKFKHVTEMSDAPLGVYNCNIDINTRFSPIGYKIKNHNFTPNGKQENRKLVKMTIEDILDNDLGEVEIIDGYEWTPTEWKPIYAPLMKRLYELKESNTGIKQNVVKRTANAIWGSMGQIIKSKTKGDKFGDYANPMGHALVEAHARSKVFRTAMNNGVIPVSIQMDGLVTDKELPSLALGNNMGEWKCAHAGVPAISINADLVLLSGKTNNAIFGVEYDWMKEEIEKAPENHIYTMTRNSCVTVGKVIQQPKLLPKLGEIIPTPRSVDVSSDIKRLWEDAPQTGSELLSGKIYDSLPLSIEMIDLMDLKEDSDLLTNVE